MKRHGFRLNLLGGKEFTVHLSHDFRPLHHMLVGARTLSLLAARLEGDEEHYARVGAILLCAASVEALCSTVGEELFGARWNNGDRPLERKRTLQKLKLIGRIAKVRVDYGHDPWLWVKHIFASRDAFMHPKPGQWLDKVEVECYPPDPSRIVELLRQQFPQPLRGRPDVHGVIDKVDTALQQIWTGLGKEMNLLNEQGEVSVEAQEKP